MSDTVQSTAPVQSGSEASIVEAGARRLAALSTAAPATSDQRASPEAQATTAAAAQSETQQPLDTGDSTQEQQETGETEAEKPPSQPVDPNAVVFTTDDGTPVTAREAQQGYLRQQDYSQKTQVLAQGRDTLKSMLEETVSHREVAAQIILGSLPQVDDSLRATDPAVWAAQRLEREDAIRRVVELRAQNQSAREQVQQIDQHEFDATLVRLLPHLAKPGAADQERDSVVGYVRAKGWPEATIERARRDPYIVAALAEAARFQAVRQGGAKGGQASAAARLQPSPTIAQAQIRPAPAGTARAQQGQMRSGDAVRTPTRPGGGLRSRYDAGAARLAPIGR
jgi:hypothetical protein